jgi:WD40 repeat protein
MAFAGGYLATVGWSTVALVDLSTGLTVAHLPIAAGHVTALEANPSEDLIAVGACGRAAELWNVTTRRLVRRIAVRRECVEAVAFSPDGALLATVDVGNLVDGRCCDPYGKVQIWDVRTGALQQEIAKSAGIRSVVFGRNGRWLAGADSEGNTILFEWPSGRQLRTLGSVAGAPIYQSGGVSSPDGKYLAWRGTRELKVWNVEDGTLVSSVQATASEFLDDGRLAYVDEDRLRIVTLPNGPIEEKPLEKPEMVGDSDVMFEKAPEWRRIHRNARTIAGSYDSRTVVWDTGAAKLRDLASPALLEAETLQWRPSGTIAVKERYSGVSTWTGASGQPLELETDDDDRDDALHRAVIKRVENYMNVTHSAFSPDGHWVAASRQTDDLDAVDVWPAKGGDGVTLDTSDVTYGPQPPAFSGDSRWLATFVKGESVTLWSTGSWKLERTWTLPGTGRALAFASRGARMAIAADGEAAIWDARTARKLVTLIGRGTSRVTQVAWSPDGHHLITQSDDGVLRFWNASNGRLLASLYAIGDTRDWLLVTTDGRFDGSERALATLVAWRTGDRVSLDKRLTERHRVRNLWRQLLKTVG